MEEGVRRAGGSSSREVLAAAQRFLAEGQRVVLVTVLGAEGPSYRRPGARMVVSEAGEVVGSVSGPCVEAELIAQAIEALQQGRSFLLTLDTSADALEGFGLGCGTALHLLIDADPASFIEAVSKAMRLRQEVPITSYATETGGGSRLGHEEGLAGLMLQETLRPAVRLLVFGDGFNVYPLLQASVSLGWETINVRAKPGPPLDYVEQVLQIHPQNVQKVITLDHYTAVVVMTHGYDRDRELLRALSGCDAFYVGLMGSRGRSERLIREAGWQGENLYAPCGLDVGSETPEEIAISITGEIMAVANRHRSGHLRDRAGAIHAP